jgi:succinyltransferase-like protein
MAFILQRRMSTHTPAASFGKLIGRLRRWPSFVWRLEGRLKGVRFEGRCDFLGRPMISVARNSRLVIGDGVRLYSAVRANPLACFQPCVLRALSPGSSLILARGVGLSGAVICAGSSIEVGEGTIFGSGAMVIDNDFHTPQGEWEWTDDCNLCGATARPIRIGRGAFIGARAIVLKGVTIGDRAIVGAGAVVTQDVPARHKAVGNPARIIEPEPNP